MQSACNYCCTLTNHSSLLMRNNSGARSANRELTGKRACRLGRTRGEHPHCRYWMTIKSRAYVDSLLLLPPWMSICCAQCFTNTPNGGNRGSTVGRNVQAFKIPCIGCAHNSQHTHNAIGPPLAPRDLHFLQLPPTRYRNTLVLASTMQTNATTVTQ